MTVTKEQAIAELARRELARRGVSDLAPAKKFNPFDVGQNIRDSRGKGLFGTMTGNNATSLIPTTKDELFDAGKVVARQLIPGARGEDINPFTQGPFGLGLNFGGIHETKGLIPKPKTDYGKGMEGSADMAQLVTMGIEAAPAVKAGYRQLKLKMAGGPTGAMKKAEDEMIRILTPPNKKLNRASEKGLNAPESITKSIPYVKPAKTYDEFAGNLRKSKLSSIKERNNIIRKDNFKISEDYLLPLRDEIESLKRQPQTKSVQSEIEEMEGVLKAHQDFNSQKGFNRVQAQVYKQKLQKQTEPLLKKIAAGESIQRSAAEIKALDKIRFGLKTMVEGGNPEVKRLNESFAALKETEGLARNQANLAKKANPTLLDKVPFLKNVLHAMVSPKQAAFQALDFQPTMKGRTKNIAKLFEMAQEASREKPPVMPKKRALLQGPARRSLLPAPQRRKGLPVSPEYGEGFERKPLPPNIEELRAEADQRRANALFQIPERETPKIISLGRALMQAESKKTSPKKFGINPFTGKMKPSELVTALQAAMKRKR
ncbi:hypothetical protein KW786_03790 [Candidatus Parcubacteria bacterium]|nr:hypothetical protein [Candidatus Parcubacteria bacterium]